MRITIVPIDAFYESACAEQIGMYANTTGLSTCAKCHAGTANVERGKSTCMPCEVGFDSVSSVAFHEKDDLDLGILSIDVETRSGNISQEKPRLGAIRAQWYRTSFESLARDLCSCYS
jgi:hypothetical protein